MASPRDKGMSLRTYVLIVWLLYLALCGLMLAMVWPPRLETLAAAVGGSFLIAWVGTIRAIQIQPQTSPRFLLASVIHGIVLFSALAAIWIALR